MPSVNSSSRPKVWPSSTFTTPSLPTFSMASAMTSPVARRDGGDPGDVLLARDLLRLRLDVLDHRGHGALDAALERHRVGTGGDHLEAFTGDRLGEPGR